MQSASLPEMSFMNGRQAHRRSLCGTIVSSCNHHADDSVRVGEWPIILSQTVLSYTFNLCAQRTIIDIQYVNRVYESSLNGLRAVHVDCAGSPVRPFLHHTVHRLASARIWPSSGRESFVVRVRRASRHTRKVGVRRRPDIDAALAPRTPS